MRGGWHYEEANTPVAEGGGGGIQSNSPFILEAEFFLKNVNHVDNQNWTYKNICDINGHPVLIYAVLETNLN